MLDVYCFKCLLQKQTLQVLLAYLNIKTSSECLGKRSNDVFKRQNNNVIRTLYNVSMTSLENVIRSYKKTCHFNVIQTLCYVIYNVIKTFSKRFCVSWVVCSCRPLYNHNTIDKL